MLAWLRRLIVSVGIGGASYAFMLGIMVLSVVYDRAFEPIITFAFDAGRSITNWLDSLVSGTYWGQIAVNHLRERVNMTYVVLSIPAIVIATVLVGIPLNWLLGGTRSGLQRMAIVYLACPPRSCWQWHLYLQRPRAGDLLRATALCRLDLAGLVECVEFTR